MGDMRDALRKAGAVSGKQVRQSQHKDRVRRTELGTDGLEAERQRKEQETDQEQERKRQEDRTHEQGLRATQADEAQHARLHTLLADGNLMSREAGPRRFHFEHPDGFIYFLEVAPGLIRRLQMGDAAIVAAEGVLPTDFIAVSGKVAGELRHVAPERLLLWNTGH